MNEHTDIERVLERWFDDGPSRMPDRVATVVADRIDRERQRRSWRLPWRLRTMNLPIKLGAAALAVVVIAVVGYNLLPGTDSQVGGPAVTPSPVPNPSATQSTSPTIPVMPEGTLEAGTYRIMPFDSPALSVTFDVPAGWIGFGNWAILGPQSTDAPHGTGIGFIRATGLFSDPCRWDVRGDGDWQQPGDVTVGPTVDDLVEALRANTAYTSSTPADVTVGGYRGKQLDIQQPLDLDPSTCDRIAGSTEGNYFPFAGEQAGLFSQGQGQLWHIRIIDVGGTREILSVASYEGTPAPDQAAAQAIVDSMTLTP